MICYSTSHLSNLSPHKIIINQSSSPPSFRPSPQRSLVVSRTFSDDGPELLLDGVAPPADVAVAVEPETVEGR
jgi:hypothetical protein